MNKNINNHNGKEIHKDQIQKNERKESEAPSTDRIKKKYKGNEREIHPVGQRKDPINVNKTNNPNNPNVNKNSNNPNKRAPKGQGMKIGNQDKGIHPVGSPVKKRPVEVMKNARTSTNGRSYHAQAATSNTDVDSSQRYMSEKENFNSSNTAKYLYVIAAVLFIAWIVGYFFYKLDANIHMLLALAIIVGVISFMQGKRNKTV